MTKHGQAFFCENCVMIRISKKHIVRITKDGSEIIQDTCECCDTVQQIESFSSNDEKKNFRISNNPNQEIK